MSRYPTHEDVDPEFKCLFGVEIGMLPRHKIPQFGKVRRGQLGFVESYRDWTTYKQERVPTTYSSFDTEFDSPETYFTGESVDDVLRLTYSSALVEAAVRIATGGGRYDSAAIDWVVGPFISIVKGSERHVAVAPIVEEFDSLLNDDTVDGCFRRDDDGEIESIGGYRVR